MNNLVVDFDLKYTLNHFKLLSNEIFTYRIVQDKKFTD